MTAYCCFTLGTSSSQEQSNLSSLETSSPILQKDGSYRIDKITYNPRKKLGEGSMGTAVFHGKYGTRAVAVKRVGESIWSNQADNESQLLLQVDSDEHIVRYFGTERCIQFVYIAIELCDANLKQCVEGHYKNPKVNLVNLLRHALKGLSYLHNLEFPIVHKDIKPSNILICTSSNTDEPIGKLADLGLAKQLNKFHDTFSVSSGQGSRGWMAPELMQAFSTAKHTKGFRTSLKVDIFSMGCVVSYACTEGKHPFGEDILQRDVKIAQGKYELDYLRKTEDFAALNLIEKMIAKDPQTRPTAESAIQHPKFWTHETVSSFFTQVDSLLDSEHGATFVELLERGSDDVIKSTDWVVVLKRMLQSDKIKLMNHNYKRDNLRDLIRAISDYVHHYNLPGLTVKASNRAAHNKFLDYWLVVFPNLLLHTYKTMESHKTHPNLTCFYDQKYSFGKF